MSGFGSDGQWFALKLGVDRSCPAQQLFDQARSTCLSFLTPCVLTDWSSRTPHDTVITVSHKLPICLPHGIETRKPVALMAGILTYLQSLSKHSTFRRVSLFGAEPLPHSPLHAEKQALLQSEAAVEAFKLQSLADLQVLSEHRASFDVIFSKLHMVYSLAQLVFLCHRLSSMPWCCLNVCTKWWTWESQNQHKQRRSL